MDILIGITTKDSVLLVTSKAATRGITVYKATDDKTRQLSDKSLMAFTGEAGDTVNFAEFVQANVRLYEMRNGYPMSTTAIASFTRTELAQSLRSRSPYQTNILIGGYDDTNSKPTLNWIDYLASNVKLPYAAHGYAAYYIISLLDRHWVPDLTVDQGLELLRKCVAELRLRMPIDFKGIQVKKVDKTGVHRLEDM